MANQNIGHFTCPLSKQLSVVRADKRGKLYYFSQFGKITPNLPQGQKWLSEKATLWPDGIQPDNIRLESLYVGAPPIVTLTQSSEPKREEKALTPQVEEKREEKALTDKPVTKKKPFLSELFENWSDDDE